MSDSARKRPPALTNAKGPPAYTVQGHIWIEGTEGTFLGVGRITLLVRIKEFGSITRAAKSLKMSYRKAWELVESMNRQSPTPLVTACAGGKNGGGATLTGAGEKAIETFRKLDSEFKRFREREGRRVGGTGKR
ncbi:MAG: LysR family transcriptional regulator [Deltaproteobacteria bacterium]|nr:LysR family transcriptional regulator [Deltaproteobacteria bacterium]